MTSTPEEVSSLTAPDDGYHQTTSNPQTNETDYVVVMLYWDDLLETIFQYVLPVELTSGVVLNCVAFFVMARKALQSASYVYVAVLAILDLLITISTCLVLGSQYLWAGRYDLFKLTGCNAVIFMRSLLPLFSSWTLVLFTIERTLLVYIVNTGFTTRIKRPRTAVILICLTCAMVCITHWNLFGGINNSPESKLLPYKCTGVTPYLTWYKDKVFSWVTMSMYIYLPAILLLALNLAIACRFQKAFPNNPPCTQTTNNLGNIEQGNGERGVPSTLTLLKEAKRVTLTVVGLSVLFLVTMIPFSITFNLIYIEADTLRGNGLLAAKFNFAAKVTQLFSGLNHCLNAFIYLVLSPTFRSHLRCYCTVNCY